MEGFRTDRHRRRAVVVFSRYVTIPLAWGILLDPSLRMLIPVEMPPTAVALRILLVEDHPEVAAAQALLLRALGYEVQTAADGPTAIEMAKSQRPDVAVVDIGLPGIDGYQVAESLRRDPATSGIRLIALTAYGSAEDRQRSQRSGFEAHLVKPASIDQLCRALRGPPGVA